MASTGSVSRRNLIRALAGGSLAVGVSVRGEATDYSSAVDVLDAIDRLERDVAGRLSAIARSLPSARPFVAASLADHERHRGARAEVRRRLHLPASGETAPAADADRSLAALREAQEALVYAHAEGLPALGDPWAVARLVDALVDLSRHLTTIDLWIEAEQDRA